MPKSPGVYAGLLEARALIEASMDAYSRRQTAVTFALVLVGAALGAIGPFIYKLLIDALPIAAATSAHLSSTLALLIGAYVISQYLDKCLVSWRACAFELGSQRIKRLLTRHVASHMVRLPVSFHLEQQIGGMTETISQGLGGIQTLLQHLQVTLLPIALEFLAMILVLTYIRHPGYLAILSPAGIVYGIAFWHSINSISAPSRRAVEAHAAAQGVLSDALVNIESLKAFVAEETSIGRYDESLAEREDAARRLLKVRTVNALFIASIFAFVIGTVVTISIRQVLAHSMSIGDFVLLVSYTMRLMLPLEAVGVALRDSAQALAFLHKMFQILQLAPEELDTEPRRSPVLSHGHIRFENVTLTHQDGRTVLRDVNFEVTPGSTVGIVGSSGAGKSSLMRLLFRFHEPSAGRILMDGVPLREIPLGDLRRSMALIPQDVVLSNDTIGRNIALGKPSASNEEIGEAAALASLDSFIRHLRLGYNSVVGARGLKLSGGERQRLAIARAAIIKPLIFVCDEATSSLDSETERDVLRNLITATQATTTFIIAHRLSAVAHAKEILVLDQGRIAERGTHEELISADGRYASMWRVQNTHPSHANGATASERSVIQFDVESRRRKRPE